PRLLRCSQMLNSEGASYDWACPISSTNALPQGPARFHRAALAISPLYSGHGAPQPAHTGRSVQGLDASASISAALAEACVWRRRAPYFDPVGGYPSLQRGQPPRLQRRRETRRCGARGLAPALSLLTRSRIGVLLAPALASLRSDDGWKDVLGGNHIGNG